MLQQTERKQKLHFYNDYEGTPIYYGKKAVLVYPKHAKPIHIIDDMNSLCFAVKFAEFDDIIDSQNLNNICVTLDYDTGTCKINKNYEQPTDKNYISHSYYPDININVHEYVYDLKTPMSTIIEDIKVLEPECVDIQVSTDNVIKNNYTIPVITLLIADHKATIVINA